MPTYPCIRFLKVKNQLVSELYQFLHILQYILGIIQHPDDFSKARPFWIDLEHETTHVYKFSCLDEHLNLNVPNSLDYHAFMKIKENRPFSTNQSCKKPYHSYTTKGGSRRLEKSRKVWMMMMVAASLLCAGAVKKWWKQESEWWMVKVWWRWKSVVGGGILGASSRKQPS